MPLQWGGVEFQASSQWNILSPRVTFPSSASLPNQYKVFDYARKHGFAIPAFNVT